MGETYMYPYVKAAILQINHIMLRIIPFFPHYNLFSTTVTLQLIQNQTLIITTYPEPDAEYKLSCILILPHNNMQLVWNIVTTTLPVHKVEVENKYRNASLLGALAILFLKILGIRQSCSFIIYRTVKNHLNFKF